jgi:hypothetical protein
MPSSRTATTTAVDSPHAGSASTTMSARRSSSTQADALVGLEARNPNGVGHEPEHAIGRSRSTRDAARAVRYDHDEPVGEPVDCVAVLGLGSKRGGAGGDLHRLLVPHLGSVQAEVEPAPDTRTAT